MYRGFKIFLLINDLQIASKCTRTGVIRVFDFYSKIIVASCLILHILSTSRRKREASNLKNGAEATDKMAKTTACGCPADIGRKQDELIARGGSKRWLLQSHFLSALGGM